MKRSASCIADTEIQADAIVGKLRSAGVSDNDISVLFPDKRSTRDFAHEKETTVPECATIGVGTAGIIGGTIGLLAGIGELAILGLGTFIAAGPIIAALSRGAIGAGVSGLTGALIGLGIPEYEAKSYEGKVKEGGIWISVHSESDDETTSAKSVFEEEGAHDISGTGEAHADVKDSKDLSELKEISANEASPVEDIGNISADGGARERSEKGGPGDSNDGTDTGPSLFYCGTAESFGTQRRRNWGLGTSRTRASSRRNWKINK